MTKKKDKYMDLAAMCLQAGWRAFTFPVEVGSAQRPLNPFRVTGSRVTALPWFPPLVVDVLQMMERNTGEGWPPADDPEACTMAPSEVRQTELPSRVRADIWH